MAVIKDKVVTVESLSALHEYNKDTYMPMVNPAGSGTMTMNGSASFSGNISTSGNVDASKGTITSKNMEVSGGANISGDTSVGSLTIGSDVKLTSSNDTLTVDGSLEVNDGLGIANNIILRSNSINDVDGDSGIKGIHSNGSVETIVSLLDLTETKNLRIGYGNRHDGNTSIYGVDINLHCGSVSETFTPYYRAGDTIDFIVKTAGFVTNNRKAVAFMIPITKPVIGSPTATITSENGFILRQNGNYTHGSDGGVSPAVYVQPTSYFIEPNYNNGFVVTATFDGDTTDIINNSPIGIVCEGTVTLS